jgi:hypothetical protein
LDPPAAERHPLGSIATAPAVIDIVPLLILSAPVWIVLGVAVAVVCVKGARHLRSGEAPGWQTIFLAWATSVLLLWLPLVAMARTIQALALAGAYATFAAVPFLGMGVVLNRGSTVWGAQQRVWGAAACGAVGIIVTLVLAAVLGQLLGFERYP